MDFAKLELQSPEELLRKKHISILGPIGAGKTTLAEEVAKRLQVPYFAEPVKDNPFLVDFYKDMKGKSFHMEMYMLVQLLEQHW